MMKISNKSMRTIITIADFFLVGVLCFSLGHMLITGECNIGTGISSTIIAIVWILYGWFMYCNVDNLRQIIEKMW